MQEERQVVRLGRREGVAGDSPVWEVRAHGHVARTDRAGLRWGLRRGLLTGIEEVRRADGDWGPLFGRPIYREVFGPDVEPRDHAKQRAATRTKALQRASLGAVGVAGLALLVGFPGWSGGLWTQAALLTAGAAAVVGGLLRLFGAMEARALTGMADRLVPPVKAPPPPEDWAQRAAEDEIDAYLRGENES